MMAMEVYSPVTHIEDHGKRYNFSQPDKVYHLPPVLHEISGLTDLSNNVVACVQDELGLIFIYDLEKEEILNKIQFGPNGDYEGITYTGSHLYVLRSDAVLISCVLSKDFTTVTEVDSINTNIPAIDNEGLCYDKNRDRLLIGSKSKLGKGSAYKDIRGVYEYDLKTRQISKEPVVSIYRSDVIDYANKNNIDLPTKLKKKSNKEVVTVKVAISAIAVNSANDNYYILSAKDHLLIITNSKGEIQDLYPLDKNLFQKAEGITFLDSGDILISNEGKRDKPTILKFKIHNQ